MSAQANAQPVLIKRKKVINGGGHHGGAWKVAYADFVTAMMAFFMLMWLLNATTEKQRKGIADYFSPTIPISRVSGGGEGSFGGESVFSEDQMSQTGTGALSHSATPGRQAMGQTGTDPTEEARARARFEEEAKKIEEALMGVGGESMLDENLQRHVVTRVTDEGLIVDLSDVPDAPLFSGDTATPEPVLRDLARVLVKVFDLVENPVAVQGHIRSFPHVLKENPSWDLSTQRAQSMRILLQEKGLDESRVARVAGFADRQLAVRNPMAARNNRLEIILLRR